MNIMGIGTISGYINALSLDMKVQDRMNNQVRQRKLGNKQDGQAADGKKDESMDPQAAELKRWAESERRGQTIASIKSKMMSGAYLTDEELSYLQTNCPDLYEEAMQIQKEREAYKRELKNCRSKEDADKLYQRKMDSFYSEARHVTGNTNMPKHVKSAKIEFITMRMNAVKKEHSEYVDSRFYGELPAPILETENFHKKTV